jgi:hypothetical protein
MILDVLKHGDDADTQEKRDAIEYLQEAHNKKTDYIKRIIDSFEGDRIGKDALINKVADTFFRTYDLRMAITGRKLAVVEPSFKESPVPQQRQ